MKKRKTIIKILVLGAWFLVLSGMATLLLAANGKEQVYTCTDVVIRIKGVGEKLYIDQGEILNLLKASAGNRIVGERIGKIKVGQLERILEKHLWIRDAELYFDNRDVLHVSVFEREPIARVFTTAGRSFYIDSAGHRMPLLPEVRVRVPVVTNFTAAKNLNAADSTQLRAVTTLARYITEHPFWNAQIAQIDITPEGSFELLPLLGNHTVLLGSSAELDEKMNRLFIFYKEVIAKTGFDRYPLIDVRFRDQVIGRRASPAPVDSAQLQKNIEELMERTRLQFAADSIAAVQPLIPFPLDSSRSLENPTRESNQPSPTKTIPTPAKEKKEPKAVMKKRSA